ncbi:MAG: spermidine/putrescine ABC transporter substrate-binding protein [Actinobacteria bacterium]|nr:spermidine/putrescine ABC transporter substrate-binding protein [Actinomycetota bacterium]
MRTSRRQFLARTAQVGVLLGAGIPLLNACGGDSGGSGDQSTEPIADGLQPEKGPLRIVNYADYVNPEVIADFEAKYGVKVEISTIDTDTEAVAKLASGALKVDVHHSMASTSIGNLIKGGLIQPLNRSYLTNRGNVIEAFDDPWYDPGAVYSVPYTFFGTGIGYRADRIDPAEVEAQGWDTLWNAAAFKGQVSILDDEREAFTMAMLRKGITDINTLDQAIIDQALADVTELIDLVNVKVNIEGYKDIPEGTTTIAHTWSADLIAGAASYLPEGTTSDVLGFWHPPSEQYVVNNDSMGVLANAENPVLAHLYIDFLLDNAVAEKNFSWVGYLPALTKLDADYVIGAGYVPENLRSCVPTNDDIAKGLKYKALGPEGDAQYEAAWSKFTAGG